MNLKAKTSPKRNIVFAVENIGRDLHWRLWRLFWYYCLHYCCWGLTLEERQYLRESASSFRKNTFLSFHKICADKWDVRMWYLWCGSWHVNDGAGPGSSVSVLMMVTRFIFSSGSWLMNIATRNIVTQSRVKLSSERWWC